MKFAAPIVPEILNLAERLEKLGMMNDACQLVVTAWVIESQGWRIKQLEPPPLSIVVTQPS